MRKSDSEDSTFFRAADRVFCMNGGWYYQTREDDHGPFPTRQAAELDMRRYAEEMSYFDGSETAKPSSTGADADFANFSLVDKD